MTSNSLTKFPLASLREVASLSLSYMLVLFSGCLMGFCDRIILAQSSLKALEASVSAFYLIQLFQLPIIRIVSVVQMYVGQYKGANRESDMGAIVWQMIWFSLISMLFILPIALPVSQIFFKSSIVQTEGLSYFQYLISVNFLFAIGAALSCFYLGQGKSKKVLLISLMSQAINLLLDLVFVFGIEGWIVPMGAKGAALASGIAEFCFCVILFADFFKEKYRLSFGTGDFAFKKPLFFQALKLGIPRGFSKFIIFLSWIAINHIIMKKSEPEYLAVLAFGGSIILFITCFNEGMGRAVTTIGSYVIGAKKTLIWKIVKSAILFSSIASAILIIPSLIFRGFILHFFFKEEPSLFLKNQLHFSLYWIFLYFYIHGLNLISLGLINAYGDPKFHLIFSVIFPWISFFSVYFFIGLGNMPPHFLWLLIAVGCTTTPITYFLRLRQEKWKTASIVHETPILY